MQQVSVELMALPVGPFMDLQQAQAARLLLVGLRLLLLDLLSVQVRLLVKPQDKELRSEPVQRVLQVAQPSLVKA
jgi:hypothetical protein